MKADEFSSRKTTWEREWKGDLAVIKATLILSEYDDDTSKSIHITKAIGGHHSTLVLNADEAEKVRSFVSELLSLGT